MSDTPETDANHRIVLGGVGGDWKVVLADFARNLERQRDEAMSHLQRLLTNNERRLDSDSEVASCNCLCKSPEVQYHKLGCQYRLIRERDEARAEAARLQMELDASCNAEELRQMREENARLRSALQRIADCTDAPDIDPAGEIRFGLHCGVEDRDCTDRYDGADYGFSCGTERALEWAQNEAKHALTP